METTDNNSIKSTQTMIRQQQIIIVIFLQLILFSQKSVSQTITTRWVKGVVPPAESEWEQKPNYTVAYKVVRWKENCGWYDINKIRDTKDKQLCWAAVATNMLHWWFDCNSRNVEKYNRVSEQKKFTQPTVYHGTHNSDIFNYFKEINLTNGSTGWTDRALNFYINGAYEAYLDETTPIDSRAGFFNDVFHAEKLTQVTSVGKKTTFDRRITYMLDNDMIGGIDFEIFGAGFKHIYTVWGADFDTDGSVVAIYIADSDDADAGDLQGLRRMKVESLNGGYTYGIGPTGGAAKLIDLTMFGLGTQQWEQYFVDNTATEACNSLNNNPLLIYAHEKSIYIENAEGVLSVYTLAGQQLYTTAAAQPHQQIEVPAAGFYLVKTANETRKVVVK